MKTLNTNLLEHTCNGALHSELYHHLVDAINSIDECLVMIDQKQREINLQLLQALYPQYDEEIFSLFVADEPQQKNVPAQGWIKNGSGGVCLHTLILIFTIHQTMSQQGQDIIPSIAAGVILSPLFSTAVVNSLKLLIKNTWHNLIYYGLLLPCTIIAGIAICIWAWRQPEPLSISWYYFALGYEMLALVLAASVRESRLWSASLYDEWYSLRLKSKQLISLRKELDSKLPKFE